VTERKTLLEEIALCASRIADTDAELMATRRAEQQCLDSAASTPRQIMCAIAAANAARSRAAEAVVALYDLVELWRVACADAGTEVSGDEGKA